MKRITLPILFIILFSQLSYGAIVTSSKAVVVVDSTEGTGPGVVSLNLVITTGDQQIIRSQMVLNVQSSATQINNDIKDFARTQIIADGGPSYANQDIIVFGGVS